MFLKTIISLVLLCLFSSYANAELQEQFKPEEFKIDNGIVVYGYKNRGSIPKRFQKEECDKYVFTDKKFTPLKNGRHIAKSEKDENIIMVEDSCLFIRTGELKLADGSLVEFYQPNTFNLDGNIVFRKTGKQYIRIYNENMKLENGQEFVVENGYIGGGLFDNGKIEYEDRD